MYYRNRFKKVKIEIGLHERHLAKNLKLKQSKFKENRKNEENRTVCNDD